MACGARVEHAPTSTLAGFGHVVRFPFPRSLNSSVDDLRCAGGNMARRLNNNTIFRKRMLGKADHGRYSASETFPLAAIQTTGEWHRTIALQECTNEPSTATTLAKSTRHGPNLGKANMEYVSPEVSRRASIPRSSVEKIQTATPAKRRANPK